MTSPHRHPAPTDLSEALAGLDRLVDQARDLATPSHAGTELATGTADDPTELKAALAAKYRQARTLNNALAHQAHVVEDLLTRRRDEVAAVLAPLRAHTQRLEEDILTINLYLGRDEHIVPLAGGDPPPADTPIVIRQLVLSMDEETMLDAARGGIDFTDITRIDEWLISDPAHLRQVLPEPRGVVVLVPRRSGRDYGDPWTTSDNNRRNNTSYWLLRNGDRLYRLYTGLTVGDRLIPAVDEFARFFVERRTNPETGQQETIQIQPGTAAWLRAEQQATARQRHYMRVALVLQGLIDRTTLFAPLPAEHIDLLSSASYDAGHVQLLTDAEHLLATGRPSFADWLSSLNRQLRPGLRIIGAFSAQEFTDMRERTGPDAGHHERLHPSRAESPHDDTIYLLDSCEPDGGLKFRYPRTQQIWATTSTHPHGQMRPPATRASCVIYRTDRFVIPIDLATLADLDYYLTSRTERPAYAQILPLLTAARDTLLTETEREQPFRDLLAAQIARTHLVPLDDARAAIPDLVQWWKSRNRTHRALCRPGTDDEAVAVRQILAEFQARRVAARQALLDNTRDTAAMAALRDQIPDAMLVARMRGGDYIALAPHTRDYPEVLAASDVYVRTYTATSPEATLRMRTWVLASAARTDQWRILWSTPTWAEWNLTASRSHHLTDPEIKDLIDRIVSEAAVHTHTEWHSGRRLTTPTGQAMAITARRHTSGRARLAVYLAAAQDLTLDDLPTGDLDERRPEMTTSALHITWHRTTQHHVTYDLSDQTRMSWQFATVGPGGHVHATPQPPWRDDLLIWSDPELLHLVEQRVDRIHVAHQRHRDLADGATRLLQTLRHQWNDRLIRHHRARFLDDYGDLALWKRPQDLPPFPYWSHPALNALVNRLVSTNTDLTGHTIATAAAAALPDVMAALPDDIHDLPLAPPNTDRAPQSDEETR